jgi:hypothetical protein
VSSGSLPNSPCGLNLKVVRHHSGLAHYVRGSSVVAFARESQDFLQKFKLRELHAFNNESRVH